MKKFHVALLGVLSLSANGAANGQSTTYSYDALGRLTGLSVSGGPNNGHASSICLDNAGNRTNYKVAPGVTPCVVTTTSTPTPPLSNPPPTNQPPTAVADSASGSCNVVKTINVTANDTDSEGNYPLSVVSVSGNENVDAVVANSTSVTLDGYVSNTSNILSYIVQDSRGATAAGQITYRVGTCSIQ